MRILVTGADGFVSRNLLLHCKDRADTQVVSFTRSHTATELTSMLVGVDWVLHLAGVNRPKDPGEFFSGNAELTQQLCAAIRASGRQVPVVYTSSVHAEQDNDYGRSKHAAEQALLALQGDIGSPVFIYRLPNVFGKWARPNYNSAVATFCHNIARGLPIQVHDPKAAVTLVYVDDVVQSFFHLMDGVDVPLDECGFAVVTPRYNTTVGELAALIQSFRSSRESLSMERVGTGFLRALYSTYVSYFPRASFAYDVPMHGDPRGVFVEMLKTPDCGQFSFFTAYPGVTRGGHYHHSKTEKFLVIKGQARFKFRHMMTGETHELVTSGDKAQIVETVPGWTHDITNIGNDEMVVMLWANEVFDRARPDTFACPV